MFASQWFNMNRVEYDIDRRMNSLLNKSPESGYIHSRNGASGSQHLCMMKESFFKISNRGYKSKGSNNTNNGEVGKGAEPLSRGCTALAQAQQLRADLSQGTSTFRWTLNPMSKSNPNLSDHNLVRLSNPFPKTVRRTPVLP